MLRRIFTMAEMHGRDLLRRHMALALLVALPLCFYLASGRESGRSLSSGGVGMAFAVSGATLFSVLSSDQVDQRLVLGGYRPLELLIGRLMFLGPLGLVIAAGFSGIMQSLSHPTRPWVLALGVAAVALESVPFGLAVGAAVPKELEGTLVLIGVVGMQMAVEVDSGLSRVLPFYGPRQLIEASLSPNAGLAVPIGQSLIYAVALLAIARIFLDRRIAVHRPQAIAPAPVDEPTVQRGEVRS